MELIKRLHFLTSLASSRVRISFRDGTHKKAALPDFFSLFSCFALSWVFSADLEAFFPISGKHAEAGSKSQCLTVLTERALSATERTVSLSDLLQPSLAWRLSPAESLPTSRRLPFLQDKLERQCYRGLESNSKQKMDTSSSDLI